MHRNTIKFILTILFAVFIWLGFTHFIATLKGVAFGTEEWGGLMAGTAVVMFLLAFLGLMIYALDSIHEQEGLDQKDAQNS